MKPQPWNHVDRWRLTDRDENAGLYASPFGAPYGAFLIPGPCAAMLKVIVSSAELDPEYPWDHVSVSCRNRCPNWIEMDFAKRLFFADDEWAMQLHAPASKHINFHPYCLHIWRPKDGVIPLPPPIMVGPAGLSPSDFGLEKT